MDIYDTPVAEQPVAEQPIKGCPEIIFTICTKVNGALPLGGCSTKQTNDGEKCCGQLDAALAGEI